MKDTALNKKEEMKMKKFRPLKLDYMSFKELLINYTITNDEYGCFIPKYDLETLNTYLSEYCTNYR